MGKIRRLDTHRKAKQDINAFYDQDSYCLIIHYSCEDFHKVKYGKTPRITSIAVRFLSTGQTKSFSIHKTAELKKTPVDKICENYDELEKEMLEAFYEFVKEYKHWKWLHWNMRNENYGFEALSFRATIWGVETCSIEDGKKYDLSILLIEKYGSNYAPHKRFPNIVKMNNALPKNWLDGADEAKAFENKEYVRLHQSTLAKVDALEAILKLAAEEKLRTDSKWTDIYGITPQGIFELVKDHWLFYLMSWLFFTGLGVVIGRFIS